MNTQMEQVGLLKNEVYLLQGQLSAANKRIAELIKEKEAYKHPHTRINKKTYGIRMRAKSKG